MSSPDIVADPFKGEKSSKADVDKERQRSDELHVGPAAPLREDDEPSEEELRVLRK